MKKLFLILLATLILLTLAYVIFNFFRPYSSEELRRDKLENTNIDKVPETLPPREFTPPEQFKDKG